MSLRVPIYFIHDKTSIQEKYIICTTVKQQNIYNYLLKTYKPMQILLKQFNDKTLGKIT